MITHTIDLKKATFDDLVDSYVEHAAPPAKARSGKRGLLRLLQDIRTLRLYFGKRTLVSLTQGDFQRFKKARLKTGWEMSLINREVAMLTRILKWALEKDSNRVL